MGLMALITPDFKGLPFSSNPRARVGTLGRLGTAWQTGRAPCTPRGRAAGGANYTKGERILFLSSHVRFLTSHESCYTLGEALLSTYSVFK